MISGISDIILSYLSLTFSRAYCCGWSLLYCVLVIINGGLSLNLIGLIVHELGIYIYIEINDK